MSGMITVTVDDAAVRALLDRLAKSVTPAGLRTALDAIGSSLSNNIQLGFTRSESPYGDRWQSLGQATILSRLGRSKSNFTASGKISAGGQRAAMAGFQPLLDTGRLRGSITHRVTGESVEVGTNVDYAATQQFGAKQGAFGRTRRGAPIPWGTIPARPFMPIRNNRADLPRAWLDEVIDTLSSHITRSA